MVFRTAGLRVISPLVITTRFQRRGSRLLIAVDAISNIFATTLNVHWRPARLMSAFDATEAPG
jgi:hypothetical protein